MIKPTKSTRIDTILFDLDGTLIDTIDLIVSSYEATFLHFGIASPGRKTILTYIGLTLEESFLQFPEADHRSMLDYYHQYNVEHINTGVGIFLQVPAMLASLKAAGYTLGIVTAKGRERAMTSLADFDLLQYFDIVNTKEDSLRHKPNPEPLLVALGKLGLEPETAACRTLYVGDAIYDVMAAKAAKMMSAVVGWTQMDIASLQAKAPDLWLDDALEVASLLASVS